MSRLEWLPRCGMAAAVVLAPLMLATLAGRSALAEQTHVPAEVLRVVDGDTVEVVAMPWPRWSVRILVRLRGIDTPELRGACASERLAAHDARRTLQDMLTAAEGRVLLVDPEIGSFAGRVVAGVKVNGVDVAAELIDAGYGRPYDGGRRAGWCD